MLDVGDTLYALVIRFLLACIVACSDMDMTWWYSRVIASISKSHRRQCLAWWSTVIFITISHSFLQVPETKKILRAIVAAEINFESLISTPQWLNFSWPWGLILRGGYIRAICSDHLDGPSNFQVCADLKDDGNVSIPTRSMLALICERETIYRRVVPIDRVDSNYITESFHQLFRDTTMQWCHTFVTGYRVVRTWNRPFPWQYCFSWLLKIHDGIGVYISIRLSKVSSQLDITIWHAGAHNIHSAAVVIHICGKRKPYIYCYL